MTQFAKNKAPVTRSHKRLAGEEVDFPKYNLFGMKSIFHGRDSYLEGIKSKKEHYIEKEESSLFNRGLSSSKVRIKDEYGPDWKINFYQSEHSYVKKSAFQEWKRKNQRR